MIQRKQSLWLFLAALLNAGVFLFDIYHADVTNAGIVDHKFVRVQDHFPSLLIALVMTLLPLITIFMFRNRKRQTSMTVASIIATLSFEGMALSRVSQLEKMVPAPTNGSYWVGAVLPVASLIFLIMAAVAIRKDEKLVRSMDRLR
jgi:dolichol kinase